MSNATEYKPTAVVNTLASAHMDIVRRLGIPADYQERSTINESLEILPGQRPENPLTYSHMRYLVLGNMGHISQEVAPDVKAMMPVAHSPTDAAPWGTIPIVVRDLDDDLPESIRDLFCLRKIKEYHGQRKICYFGMRINLDGVKAVDYQTIVKDGVKDVSTYRYTDSDLHPPRPVLPDYNYDVVDQVLTADGKYANSSAVTIVSLDSFVLGELINMARVVYNTPLAAVVSEWCLCSGIDVMAKGESFVGPSEVIYKEVICCQVNMFICQYGNAADHSEKMDLTVNVAQTTPYPIYSGIPDAQKQIVRRG